MRLIALVIVVCACGKQRADMKITAAPDPSCELAADGKLDCTTVVTDLDPAAAISVMKRDKAKFGTAVLADPGSAPVTAQRWYELGSFSEAQDPRLAAELYDLAESRRDQSDLELGVAIAIGKVHVAQDGIQRQVAARQLVELAPKSPRLLESALLAAGKTELAAKLCRDPSARIVWQCARANPAGAAEYLPVIARLPSLSARDFVDSLSLTASLPGLQCLSVTRWTPDPGRLSHAQRRSTTSASEIMIYVRIRDELSPAGRQCLLEEASVLCLAMINERQSCPLPMVIADYVRAISPRDQAIVIDTLFDLKGAGYRWFSHASSDAAPALLHLHLVLADVLADVRVSHRRREAFSRTPYHIKRAAALWQRFGDPRIPFAEMLSPEAKYACQRPDYCDRVCPGGLFNSCRSACSAEMQDPEVRAACR